MERHRLAQLTLLCSALAMSAQAGDPPSKTLPGPLGHADLHGDALPDEALLRLGTVRLRHGNHVCSIAISKDGKRLVSAGGDHTVRVWDMQISKELRRFEIEGDAGFLHFVALSPDDNTLAVPTRDKIRFWDLKSGKELPAIENAPNTNDFAFAVFSPDGKTLAIAGSDVTLWDVASRKETRKLKTYVGAGRALAFSADGSLIAAGDGGAIRLWEVASGKLLQKFRRHGDTVTSVAFSPDGTILASAGDDNAIRLWDVATGQALGHIGHPNTRLSTQHFAMEDRFNGATVLFSPDGKALYSSAKDDRFIRMWDVATRQELRQFLGHMVGSMCLALSTDGQTLAAGSGDSCIRLWDTVSGKERFADNGHRGRVFSVAFLDSGKRVVSAGRDNAVRVWDRTTGRELHRFGSDSEGISFVAFSRDATLMASARHDDETIQLWDVTAAKGVRELVCSESGIYGLAFSADSKRLAAIDDNDNVALFDLADGKEIRKWHAQTGDDNVVFVGGNLSRGIAFSPDAKLLATVERKNNNQVSVCLWDTSTGKLARKFAAADQEPQIQRVLFSPDGRTLATMGRASIGLWSPATGRQIARIEGLGITHPQGMVNMESMAFSADGRFLVAAGQDSHLVVWETATGQEIRKFATKQGWVGSVAFAADGRTLACGGLDTTILLWDLVGSAPAKELSAKELDERWAALSGEAGPAYKALWSLLGSPQSAVRFLREQVRPLAPIDPQRLARLIADLDSDQFDVRQKAGDELEKHGELAEEALSKVLMGKPSLEVRQRVEMIIQKMPAGQLTGEQLRLLRAVTALERIGTPEARQVLEQVAQGVPRSRLTQEAKAAAERLALHDK
jgi:WD40 repeat protein